MNQKRMLRGVIVAGVPLILYHLVAFLVPFQKTTPFWVSYVFTLAAFATVIAAFYIAFVRSPDGKSRFYGFPIARIGWIYFVVQLVLGLLCMALGRWIPWWAALLVQAIALGAAVVGLVATDVTAEEIQSQDFKLKKNVAVMRALQSQVHPLAGQCDNPDAAAAVQKLSDQLRYSDPVSSDALAEIERDLAAIVDDLQQAVLDADAPAIRQLCRKASNTLVERNRLCKLNKGV